MKLLQSRFRDKLWALRSYITSIPRLAWLIISAQVLITRPWLPTTDWLKLKSFMLKATVLIPKEVNQIPIMGQAIKKKWKEQKLLKLAYCIINRPNNHERLRYCKFLPLEWICNLHLHIHILWFPWSNWRLPRNHALHWIGSCRIHQLHPTYEMGAFQIDYFLYTVMVDSIVYGQKES